jgi:hypothetical protein
METVNYLFVDRFSVSAASFSWTILNAEVLNGYGVESLRPNAALQKPVNTLFRLCVQYKLQWEHVLLAEKLCLVTQSNFFFVHATRESLKAQSVHHIFALPLAYAMYFLSPYFTDIHCVSNFPESQGILVQIWTGH